MVSQSKRSLGYRAGQLASLIIIIAGAYLVFLLLSSSDQTRIAVLTAAISIGTLVYTQNKNSKREIESRMFARKAEAYEEILQTITDLMGVERTGIQIPQEELVLRLQAIQPRLLIWAGTDVLLAWQGIADPPEGEFGALVAGNALMAALRRELGHDDDDALGPLGLVGVFLRPEDRRNLASYRP